MKKQPETIILMPDGGYVKLEHRKPKVDERAWHIGFCVVTFGPFDEDTLIACYQRPSHDELGWRYSKGDHARSIAVISRWEP